MRIHRIALVLWLSAFTPTVLAAQAIEASIDVLSGSFGRPGAKRKLDIAEPLRTFCASATARCDVYCSATSFGHYKLDRHPICRVTWRCPDGNVHSTEAAKEEQILLRCVRPEGGEPAPDNPTPTTYTPPGR
jgi:hypothetical protein